MEYRTLGQAKTRTSAVGLGCMGMSEFYGESDDQQSLKTLSRAVELGINLLDTADTYGFGHNETLIGQFLRQGGPALRERLLIASKFGIVRQPGQYQRRIDNGRDYINNACEASLQRLGVETIDLYYCHRRNPQVPIEDMMLTLADLVRAGKVRQIGLSEISAQTLRRAHAIHPVAAVQSEYSLWSREPEREMLAACRELGTTFVAYSPLGRAFLTGAVSHDSLAGDDFRKHNPRFQGEAAVANQRLVEALGQIALGLGLTNAQVALAWLLARHPHVVPIPGTRRIAYLEQNVSAVDCRLSGAVLTQLDQLFSPDRVVGARYPQGGMVGIE